MMNGAVQLQLKGDLGGPPPSLRGPSANPTTFGRRPRPPSTLGRSISFGVRACTGAISIGRSLFHMGCVGKQGTARFMNWSASHVGAAGNRFANTAAYLVPERVQKKYAAGTTSAPKMFGTTCAKIGQTAANTAVAGAAYGAYLVGNKIVDSSRYLSQAVPGLTKSIPGVMNWMLPDHLQITVATAIIKDPAKLVDIPLIGSVGNGLVALSAVLAASALAAHCAKGDYTIAARKAGSTVAGLIGLHAFRAVSEKLVSMPIFTAGFAAYQAYAYASQVQVDTSRKTINILASLTVGGVGATVMGFSAQIIPQVIDGLSVVNPAIYTAVTAGTLGLYGQRVVGRKLQHRHVAIRNAARIATFATFAAIATGVALVGPQLAVINAISVTSVVTQSFSAVTFVATGVGMYRTYNAAAKKTAKVTGQVIGAGAAVLAFGATAFVATQLDAYAPVTALFFAFKCSQVGDLIGSRVASFIDKGGERGATYAEGKLVKCLAGLTVLFGFATVTTETTEKPTTAPTPTTVAEPPAANPDFAHDPFETGSET